MRVLHVYNQHRGGGGANNATRATIDLLRERGIDVRVLTRSSREVAPTLIGRIKAGVNLLVPLDGVGEFKEVMDEFRPDLVHVHEMFPLMSPWILPECSRRAVPVVMSCVDYRLTCPVTTHLREGAICTLCVGGHEYWAAIKNCRNNLPESLTMATYSAVVRKFGLFSDNVDRFIAPSEFTRAWLAEHAHIPSERITTISPAVDIPSSAADPARGTYIGFAGRFSPEKGIGTLIDAARISGLPVRLARHEASLVMMEIPPDIEVVTTRTAEDLAAFYRGAAMMIVPSIWFETFGLVAAEAMSHGVPVIASRIGAVPDLITDGVDGILFETGSAPDLAEKMTNLWRDRDSVRHLGIAAREKAARLWSSSRHVESMISIYKTATQSKSEKLSIGS